MIICKLCGRETNTSPKSHIIPKCFYPLIQEDAKHMVQAGIVDGVTVTKFPQAGIWAHFLCGRCETQFGAFDSYGCRVFGQMVFRPDIIEEVRRSLGTRLKGVNAGRLKMFILSVLWRASVCESEFFRHVDLGSDATLIRDLIVRNEPPASGRFSFSIKLIAGGPRALYQPFSRSLDGVRFAELFLPRVAIQMKLDDEPSPSLWKPIENSGDHIFAYLYPYAGSEMEEWVRAIPERFGKRP